jgi:hypothetical protein
MAAVAWRLLRKAVAFEVLMWRSLYRWVFRRPLTREPGAATFGYATATAPIMWTFIVPSTWCCGSRRRSRSPTAPPTP